MAVIDIFTYNGERDILKLHLSVLDPVVDKFVIVEANQTFSGKPKVLHFFRDNRFFKPWWKKIDYYIVNNWEDEELWSNARESANTKGAHHWQQEFYIKENIKKALKHTGTQDDDLVIVGDVDEILNPETVINARDGVHGRELILKLPLQVYSYYLNNASNEQFFGPIIGRYRLLKDKCLNHVRSTQHDKVYDIHGWHFTSMGGAKELKRKLEDSYTAESYATPEILSRTEEFVKERKDFLNRSYTYTIDESMWPQYLKDNRAKFKHLLWQPTTS